MGIDLWNFQFMMEAYARGGAFGRTLQIGRQEIHMGEDCYSFADDLLRQRGFGMSFREARRDARYADETLFPLLGATETLAADASAYEGAAIVHDFNNPIDPALHQTFDTVFDGGSLEHIFNVPGALANEMNLVKVGGRILSTLPANNWLGHGFYQFSQELPFRVFTPANGFRLQAVFFSDLAEHHQFWDVSDLHRRAGGEIGRTNSPNGILFIAEKIAHVPLFRRWPQQGDYHTEWENFGDAPDGQQTEPEAAAEPRRRGLLGWLKAR